MAVDRDDGAGERPEIDPELRRRRAVDQPQPDPPVLFGADDLRIGERAVIGEECVIVDVVQVRRHAGPHVHGGHVPRTHVHLVAHAAVRHRALTAVGFGQSGEQLVRRPEAEIMQHQHHLLPVGAHILDAAHDQRRGHQALFLHALMGVHPVRACDRRIVIGARATRGDQRRLGPGKAVLCPGRQLAMPVDNGGCAGLIHEIDVKALAWRERDARFSVWPDKPEHSRRLAVDVEGSGAGGQAKLSGARFGRGSSPRCPQNGDRARHRNAGRKHHPPAGQERGLSVLSQYTCPCRSPFGN